MTAANAPRKIASAVRDGVAYLTLEAPPLNVLTIAMLDELSDALEAAEADRAVKAVALSAAGKAFSAGADVDEHRPEKIRAMIASFGRTFRILGRLELPIVAAVAGPALGGGFELAMMADTILASEEATFGQPEIRLGFFAPVGVVRLPEIVGPARAVEITASGRTYTSAEMRDYGLVSRVVPAGEMEDALESALKDYRRASPLIQRMNVRTLKRLRSLSFETALAEAERVFLDDLMETEDVREGLAAFFEKRRPEWKNA